MSWLVPDCDTLEQLFRHNPLLAQDFSAFVDGIWCQPHIPAATLLLCQQRLRTLLGMEDGESLLQTPTAAQQVCLDFTEIYCQDPAAIRDELASAVVSHYGDAGLVALVEALGLMNGLCRMAQLFGLEEGYSHG